MSGGTSAPEQPVANWLKQVDGNPGTFRTTGVGLKQEVEFVPFYQLPRRRYAVYWDMYTPAAWTGKEAEFRAQEEKQKKRDKVVFVRLACGAGAPADVGCYF
jgi:hypothetical protein